MTPRRFVLLALIAVLFVALVLSPLILRTLEPTTATVFDTTEVLEYWPAPDFSLTTSTGEVLTNHDLEGLFWVATFGFTTCPGICPAMTFEMKRLHDRYENENRVRFLFISVDPTHDTPAVMAQYAENYAADTQRWHFLTGSATHIQALSANGFKIGSVENPINHSSRFVLVAPDGMIRGFYDSLDADHIANLIRDLDTALEK